MTEITSGTDPTPSADDGRDGAFLSPLVLDSSAYQKLSPRSRAALVEFYRAFCGHNNGRIEMSIHALQRRLRISLVTVRKAIHELREQGFIISVEPGSAHKPTRWALSEHSINGAPPELKFLSNEQENHISPLAEFMVQFPASDFWETMH